MDFFRIKRKAGHGMYLEKFKIKDKVCVITGGGGLLGHRHAQAVLEGEGIPVLLDISKSAIDFVTGLLHEEYGESAVVKSYVIDITSREELENVWKELVEEFGHIDVLINNAANNPKVEGGSKNFRTAKFTDFSIEMWNQDLAVGLTGAMLCAQVFGTQMEMQESGVVLNISSDYGLIAPDQRVYRKEGVPEDKQIIKPVSYSVVKHGMIGLTKYLAVYWAKKGIRVNTLCPASLHNGQDDEFIEKINNLIPMGRMSEPEEYVCTILYLISEASTYMTGSTVVLDGGRTSW